MKTLKEFLNESKDVDMWVDKIIAAAEKNPKDIKKAVNIGSTQLDIHIKNVAKQIKVPANLLKVVAKKAADKLPI